MFRVMVVANDFLPARDAGWRDCGEGPWNTAADAVTFAHAEVGVPWIVVSDHQNGAVQAFGDAYGVRWSAVQPLAKRKRKISPRDAELWRKID